MPNSLRRSDRIWRHWAGLILGQVMLQLKPVPTWLPPGYMLIIFNETKNYLSSFQSWNSWLHDYYRLAAGESLLGITRYQPTNRHPALFRFLTLAKPNGLVNNMSYWNMCLMVSITKRSFYLLFTPNISKQALKFVLLGMICDKWITILNLDTLYL